MRADRRADEIVRRRDVRHPVADGLVDRVLECLAAGGDGAHLSAEQLHAKDVERLTADVLCAHVDDALQPQLGADRRRGDAVLARAGLGDDAPLAHALREQALPQRVVDLVRAGVGQILALEVDTRADPLREPLGEVERRGPAGIAGFLRGERGGECGIVARGMCTPAPARRARPSGFRGQSGRRSRHSDPARRDTRRGDNRWMSPSWYRRLLGCALGWVSRVISGYRFYATNRNAGRGPHCERRRRSAPSSQGLWRG